MEKLLVGVGAFVGGIIYASYKLDENPNKVFKMAGNDIVAAKAKVMETVTKTSEKVKSSVENNTTSNIVTE
jgi:hypothetical protein